jgi:LuxR family maltose regulon positive regulatory protein
LRGAYLQALEFLGWLRGTLIVSSLEEEDPSIRAEWSVMQSLVLYMQGEMMDCMELASRALELAPELDRRVRSLAYYVQASVYWVRENYQQATETFQKSIQYSRAAENLVAEMMSTTSLASIALEQGHLRLAFEIAFQTVERIERSGVLHPISAVIYASLGQVHYQWYQLEEAHSCFQRALHLSRLGGSNTITTICHVLLSRLSRIEGDLDIAAREIEIAADLVPAEAPEYVRQIVVSQQARIFLDLNRANAAEMALQSQGFSFDETCSFPDLPAGQVSPGTSKENLPYSVGLLYNSGLRVLLNLAQAKKDPAYLKTGIEFASRTLGRALKSQQLLVVLETLLQRAQMHSKMGDHRAGLADYRKALELAEPEGFIGVFVEQGAPVSESLAKQVEQDQLVGVSPEYVKLILDAISRSQLPQAQKPGKAQPEDARQDELIEPLTERELEVLRLMADGLKYQEIAERLFISLNTVRYHVKATYGKLNARSRIQAIELARKLRIL